MQNSAKIAIRRSLADIARPIALRKIFTAIEHRTVLPQQHLILLFRQVSPLLCYIETQGRTAGKWKHPAQRLRRQTESFRPEMKRKSSFLLFFARLFVTLRTKNRRNWLETRALYCPQNGTNRVQCNSHGRTATPIGSQFWKM